MCLISELIVRCIGNEAYENNSKCVSFNDLRISYTNLINKTCQRKQELKEQYYFDCSCIKCDINKSVGPILSNAIREIELAKEGSLMCPNCKNCVIIPSNPGKAQKCEDIHSRFFPLYVKGIKLLYCRTVNIFTL